MAVPVFDLVIMDPLEFSGQHSEVDHSDVNIGTSDMDLHCMSHGFHHYVSIGVDTYSHVSDLVIKTTPFFDLIASGLHPKPGLHPPTQNLSFL